MKLTILGSSSATPVYDRMPTAQLLNINEKYFLIDCAEGTQMQLLKYKISHHKIDFIFISHLHGDHYFGIFGLLSTMSLMGRTKPLTVFCPKDLIQLIEANNKMNNHEMSYPIIYESIDGDEDKILLDTNSICINKFSVSHSIPCYGFSFERKKPVAMLLPEQCKKYSIPISEYNNIKKGKDFVQENGNIIPNNLLTKPSPIKALKYVYLADTKYDEKYLLHASQADLLYHETTYLKDRQIQAEQRFHSTTLDAANFAILSKAKKLLVGHFSSRYKTILEFESEIKPLFPNVILAIEGTEIKIE